jgi:nucleotide-binding universal stress UspA family protein
MRIIGLSERIKPIKVNQILVSLDNSTHSNAALDAAVELAQQYHASLKGVFIEDINLLNLAQMPFCQEIGEHTAKIREITTDALTRGIYVQSRKVIKTFRNKTDPIGIDAVFLVLRGDVYKTIEKESQSSDLIVIGKTGTNPVRGRRIGSTARALIKSHTKPLLLIEEKTRLGHPIIVLYHQTALGTCCLETGRELLNPDETLIVLLKQDDPEIFSNNAANLTQWANTFKIKISIQGYKEHTIHRLFQKLNELEKGLLIMSRDAGIATQKISQEFIDYVRLPILLIRTCI